MYRNKFPIAEYAMRSTPAGATGVATAKATVSVGDHNELYLVVYVASSHPHYDSRQPDLGINIEVPGDEPDKMVLSPVTGYLELSNPVVATTLPLLGLTGYGNDYWSFDISQYGYGRIRVNHWLTQGVAATTARATYSVWVVGRGYN